MDYSQITFADYLLSEDNWLQKLETMYYLNRKTHIFFDVSVVFKTQLLKLFLDNTDLGLDENTLITACLLCNCKKKFTFSSKQELSENAKVEREYLENLGFNNKFCKICEQVNRYTNNETREPEADVLELIDLFGGMLLDRPERIGLSVNEALSMLEFRNFKDKDNRYLEEFKEFVNKMEDIKL